MPKLSFNPKWDAAFLPALGKLLNLDDDGQTKFFTNKVPVVVTKEQVTAIQALAADPSKWAEEEEAEIETAGTDTDTVDVATAAAEAGHTDAKDGDVIDIAIASQRDRDAIEAGQIISQASCDIIDQGFEAKQKVNIAPLLLFQQLEQDAKAKEKSLLLWPVPNSLLKGGKVMSGAGDDATEITFSSNETPRWDKYTFMAQNDKGKQVKRNGSYYKTAFEASPLGVKIEAQLKTLNHAMTILPELGSDHAEMGKWRGFGLPALQRRKALWEARKLYGIGRLKDAIKIARQCEAFNSIPEDHEGAPVYMFDTEMQDGKPVFVNRNEPVSLSRMKKYQGKDKLMPEPVGVYSLPAFLRFNVQEAITKAGGKDKVTVEHILATVKREKTSTGTAQVVSADDWSKKPIDNARQFENVMSSSLAYLSTDDGDIQAKHFKMLDARLAEKDGDEFLLLLNDFDARLTDFLQKYEARYNEANRQRARVRLAEKKALEEKQAAA